MDYGTSLSGYHRESRAHNVYYRCAIRQVSFHGGAPYSGTIGVALCRKNRRADPYKIEAYF